MIGAVQKGVERIQGLLTRYGADTVRAAINHSIDQTERQFRAEVMLPAGALAIKVAIQDKL